MPTEITDSDLFTKLAEKAEVCRVMRSDDEVKLKLRTPERLYTMKIGSSKADGLLRTLKCKIVELTKEKKKGRKEESPTPRETQEEE